LNIWRQIEAAAEEAGLKEAQWEEFKKIVVIWLRYRNQKKPNKILKKNQRDWKWF